MSLRERLQEVLEEFGFTMSPEQKALVLAGRSAPTGNWEGELPYDHYLESRAFLDQVERRQKIVGLPRDRSVNQPETIAFSHNLRQGIQETAQNLSRRLGIPALDLGKVIAFWTIRYPNQEREDSIQDMALALLKYQPGTPGLAFAVCRGRNLDWWKAYKYRQHHSLDADNGGLDAEDSDGVTMAEMLAGRVEWERKIDGVMDARKLWEILPLNIRRTVSKRLRGIRMNGAERVALHRFAKANPQLLLN